MSFSEEFPNTVNNDFSGFYDFSLLFGLQLALTLHIGLLNFELEVSDQVDEKITSMMLIFS